MLIDQFLHFFSYNFCRLEMAVSDFIVWPICHFFSEIFYCIFYVIFHILDKDYIFMILAFTVAKRVS